MNSRGDTIYKQLFSHPEIVRDLVAGALPAGWAQALEVEAFERVNASYASEQGKARHEDVVWRARIGGEWVYAATELADLMLSSPDGLAPFQAQQRYLLLDQHNGGALGSIVGLLFRLLAADTRDAADGAGKAFSARIKQPDLASVRASLEQWFLLTLHDDLDDTNMGDEEDSMMRTEKKPRLGELFTPELIHRMLQPHEESLQEGIEQGMQQGMQQGELLALRDVLNDLLVGEVPAEAAPKIAEADSGQLRAWIKSLARGASPGQLFAGG
jgi:hypothetical protein